MRLLFLSFYFSPDLCAGSFRSSAVVNSLVKNLPENSKIDVVTTLPNRYESFKQDALTQETAGRLTITRITLPSHRSGILDQSLAFFAYARGVNEIISRNEYDAVFATSSRLMTACLGAYASRRHKIPLYLDIRDLFVDTIKDVFSQHLAFVLKPVFSSIERWAIRSARKVNLVSEGFLPYFRDRFPTQDYALFTNGIDQLFIDAASLKSNERSNRSKIRVLYAGNIGEGQGLHDIIPELAYFYRDKIEFKVIGDGGRLDQLKSAIEKRELSNVYFSAPISRDLLIDEYLSADVLFLHLNNYPAFLKVLPSKVFEYGAIGKPIWAGVGGYSAYFLEKNISNAAVFTPCDYKGAVQAFEKLKLVNTDRREFVDSYSRSKIVNEMASDITDVLFGNY